MNYVAVVMTSAMKAGGTLRIRVWGLDGKPKLQRVCRGDMETGTTLALRNPSGHNKARCGGYTVTAGVEQKQWQIGRSSQSSGCKASEGHEATTTSESRALERHRFRPPAIM